jgi:hypothetical protein
MTTPSDTPDPRLEQVEGITGFTNVARDVTAVLGLVNTLRVGAAQAEEADARASSEITQLTERYGTRNAEALGAAMVARARSLIAGARSQADLATAQALMTRLQDETTRRENQALLASTTPPPPASGLPWLIGGGALLAVGVGYYVLRRPRRNPRRRH